MLWFVGIGLSGQDSISQETRNIVEQADMVYLEQYTSPIPNFEKARIKKLVKGQFEIAKRWMIEDGRTILNNAKKKKVVLLSYGDPFIATTHIELRTRAIQDKIKTKTIHASSSITSIVGECGLHYYKVGKIVTIMEEEKTITTPYYIIYKNLLEGNHTVLLLEYEQEEEEFFLKPRDAMSALLAAEKEQRRKALSPATYAIVASRIGFRNQSIFAGKISSLKRVDFGRPPHTIIIPGRLHFTESEALKVVAKCIDEPSDNSAKIKKITRQMIEKYIPIVRRALEEITPHYSNTKEFKDVLENAELYLQDAEKFQEQGREEIAILSIGYADGLVDALRIAKGLEPVMYGYR